MWIDDQVLSKFDERTHHEVFVPSQTMVVLGAGNDESLEVNQSACRDLNVPILRRYGGGGTVVLYPGCVVVSSGCWVKDPFKNNFYFKLLNEAVIDALAATWPSMATLSQAGISDIVLGERKVAGTSLFRSRNYLLYQASILVQLDRELVGSLLQHPTKEPEYRKGRSHGDFLTSLMEVEPNVNSVESVEICLQRNIDHAFANHLGDQLIDPVHEQKKALLARLERAHASVD